MGSSLSIENDTQDTWQCQIGSDQAAISVVSIITFALTTLAMTVTGLGALAAPFIGTVGAGSVIGIGGVSAATLGNIAIAAAAVSGTTAVIGKATFATDMVVLIVNNAETEQGFITLAPGQSHRIGPMALSLWQQAACMRVRVNPANNAQVKIETMYMRPIFSGGSAGSTLTHKIQWWINKWGGKMDSTSIIQRV